MPLPVILGIGAAIAGAVGVGSGISGAVKMADANDTVKSAEKRHKRNIEVFEKTNKSTTEVMDKLGKFELEILGEFKEFSDVIERIENRPEFKQYNKDGVTLPKYDKEELNDVSVGAAVLLGGIGGAAAGTAGGFAAAGATTAAVMAFGTASTGAFISDLGGIAAANATLAALGGGSLAAGGGGMALGSLVLDAATLGVGLLVGGIIFNITGSSISDKADKAHSQMLEAEKTINKACGYLNELKTTADMYIANLEAVNEKYKRYFGYVKYAVVNNGKVDWNKFTNKEKIATENSILLVGLLYTMCKVSLVNKAENEKEMNKINKAGVEDALTAKKGVFEDLGEIN